MRLITTLILLGLASSLYGEIETVGNYTYVTHGNKIEIANTTNAKQPSPTSSYTASNDIEVIDGEGNYIYFSTTATSPAFSVLDVSNLSSPSLIGSEAGPLTVAACKASGDYLYTITKENSNTYLKIFNTQNKSTPVLSSTFDLNASAGENVHNIALSGNYAFVAIGDYNVSIVNVSNPNSPQLASTLTYVKQGSRDYDTIQNVTVEGSYLYLVMSNGFYIYDISDIQNPDQKGHYFDSRSVWDNKIIVDGNYIYYSTGWYALDSVTIIDITDKNNPASVGEFALNPAGSDRNHWKYIKDFTLNGNYLYIDNFKQDCDANYNCVNIPQDVVIVDVSDKMNPEVVEETNGQMIPVLMYMLD